MEYPIKSQLVIRRTNVHCSCVYIIRENTMKVNTPATVCTKRIVVIFRVPYLMGSITKTPLSVRLSPGFVFKNFVFLTNTVQPIRITFMTQESLGYHNRPKY